MPDRPLKILYLNTIDNQNQGAGAERTLTTLMSAMLERGHDIALASTGAAPGLERADRDGIRVWRAGLKNIYWPKRDMKTTSWPLRRLWHVLDSYNWQMRKQFENIIEMERPDVISSHQLAGWSISALDAAADAGVPVVQVLHDYYNACPNSMLFKNGHDCETQCFPCKTMRSIHRTICNKAKAVVGVSKYVLERHLELGYFADGPARHVIHNARARADLKLDEAARQRAQIYASRLPDIVKFGFIGTIAAHKGIELLLETFREFPFGKAELIIAGSGKPDYVNGLRERFAAPHIKFLGQVEPYQFFSQVDVTVVPSLWQEPLGMIVPESFVFGVPVIASRRGGIPEMIDEGGNGMLFEPRLPGDLYRAMQFFLDNRLQADGFRCNALQSGESFLDTAGWCAKYEKLNRTVVTVR